MRQEIFDQVELTCDGTLLTMIPDHPGVRHYHHHKHTLTSRGSECHDPSLPNDWPTFCTSLPVHSPLSGRGWLLYVLWPELSSLDTKGVKRYTSYSLMAGFLSISCVSTQPKFNGFCFGFAKNKVYAYNLQYYRCVVVLWAPIGVGVQSARLAGTQAASL